MVNISKYTLILILLATSVQNAFCPQTRWSYPLRHWEYPQSTEGTVTPSTPHSYLAPIPADTMPHPTESAIKDLHSYIIPCDFFKRLLKSGVVDTLNQYPTLEALTADAAKLEELAEHLETNMPLMASSIINHYRSLPFPMLSAVEFNLTPAEQHIYVTNFIRLLAADNHILLKKLLPLIYVIKDILTVEDEGRNCDDIAVNFVMSIFEALFFPNCFVGSADPTRRVFTVDTKLSDGPGTRVSKHIFFALSAFPREQLFSIHVVAYNLSPAGTERLKIKNESYTCDAVAVADLPPGTPIRPASSLIGMEALRLALRIPCGGTPAMLQLKFHLPPA